MGTIVTPAIWLLFVLIVLRPPFRRGRLGFACFLVGMTANEIPLVLLAVFGSSMALSDPAPDPVSRAVTAVLATLVGGGLVGLQWRARTARPRLEAGLVEGLGDAGSVAGRLDAAGPGLTPVRLPPTPWLRGVLLPFQRRRRGVQRLRNVSYGPDPRAHRLDVYRGRDSRGSRPILVHLHGGGFIQGGKSREGTVMLNQLAEQGWLCLSADYRLGREAAHPNPLVDAKRVIAWAREHATEFDADPARLFLAGGSAGGHLAVSAALTPNQRRFQPGFEDAETGVAGVVVLYGYLGPRSEDPTSSPAELARADAPPMLIVHGSHDTMVPADDVRAVAATLRSASRSPVVFVELPHAQHDFDFFASVRARVVADAVGAFLGWVIAGHREAV